jgi:hypothetical protein
MGSLITIALLIGLSAFALAPARMPSFKLFLVLTVAFQAASVTVFLLLLSKHAEGPKVMGLAMLFTVPYFLFFASCAVRLIRIGMNAYARKRANG